MGVHQTEHENTTLNWHYPVIESKEYCRVPVSKNYEALYGVSEKKQPSIKTASSCPTATKVQLFPCKQCSQHQEKLMHIKRDHRGKISLLRTRQLQVAVEKNIYVFHLFQVNFLSPVRREFNFIVWYMSTNFSYHKLLKRHTENSCFHAYTLIAKYF